MPLFKTPAVQAWQSGAASSALTGSTSETVLATVTLPALGPLDRVEVEAVAAYTNNANNKTLRFRLGGIGGTAFTAIVLTTQQSYSMFGAFQNRNSVLSQVSRGSGTGTGGWGAGSAAAGTMAIDTSVSQTVVITGQLANAADSFTLESYTVRLIRG